MADRELENQLLDTPEASRPSTAAANAGGEKFIPAPDASNVWKDEKQPWAATTGGRMAIRTVSRGVMGAAFYALGGHIAMKEMVGYDVSNPKGAVQHIAKFFDVAAGKPIEKIFGENSVRFRPTLQTGSRSLGEEVIENTLNFAMATAGDSLGRNIVGLFDPHAEHKWRDENGKVSLPKAIKGLAFGAGRIFEAQMEDWFVAVPYAYQKKAQRKIINHLSPGFEYDADRALNGSSFKVDEDGKVVGTYTMEGALDLQGRFTGYNVGTMIYRDGMKKIKNKVGEVFDPEKREERIGISLHPTNIAKSGASGVRNLVRYGIKSAVKATIILTPSVPVFWTMRSGQSKHRSIGIGPDGKPLTDMGGGNIRLDRDNMKDAQAVMGDGTVIDNPFADPDFTPYGQTYGKLDSMVNQFGKFSYNTSQFADKLALDYANRHEFDGTDLRDFADRYVNGTIAYTPYIFTKNEFAHRWDNQNMDSAIYRAIDGVFSFKGKEVKAGLKGIKNAMLHRPSDVDPDHPETAPEHYDTKRNGFVERVGSRDPQLGASWQERTQKPSPDSPGLASR